MKPAHVEEIIETNVLPFLRDVIEELEANKRQPDFLRAIRLLSLVLAELCDMMERRRRK